MDRHVVDILRATDFAARRHAGQRRKGLSAEPYINHPLEVAHLLAEATGGRDPVLVMAGLLHDTVEDTTATLRELEAEFGAEVATLVAEVTDDKALPKEERKRRQIEHAPHISDRAKMIKLADKTSNLRALAASPPKDWSARRRRDYFEWAAAVIVGCRGVSAELERQFDHAHDAGLAGLEAA